MDFGKDMDLKKRPPSIRLAAITQNCCFTKVFIDSFPINMLVDTGSAVPLISNGVYKQLGRARNQLQPVSTTLTTSDGEIMNVLGTSNLILGLDSHSYNQSAIVADFGSTQGILGLDFLAKNDVKIDTRRGALNFPDFDIQLSTGGGISAHVR